MEWTTGGDPAAKVKGERPSQGQFCRLCNAWRGSLGLEPDPNLYVQHMVEVMREVRRVMRDDAVAFINKSRTNDPLAPMLFASLSAPTRARMESEHGPLPTSHLTRQVDRILDAIQDQGHSLTHDAERLRAFRASMPDEFSRQLLDVCSQRARCDACLLCARSLKPDAQASVHTLGVAVAPSDGNQDNASGHASPERHSQNINTACEYCVVSRPLDIQPHCTTSGLKPKDLVGVPWRVALALQADGWWLRSDIIWCLSGGTRVYAKTQKGEMPMTIKDMVRLDPATVKLWNGEKWTQVLGWSQSPRPDAPIEIELRSGERIGCTPDHKWPTLRGLVAAKYLKIGDVIKSTQLPAPAAADCPAFIPDMIGWFVGIYLAEGSKGKGGKMLQVACHVKEWQRFERIRELVESYGGSCQFNQMKGNAASIRIYGRISRAIIDTYISGKTAHDKHLSMACWQRSNHFLRSLLMGYLEGDGHLDTGNNRWRLGFARNYNLAADLRTLCARLGFQLRLKPSESTYQYGRKKSYRGEIRLQISNHYNVKADTEIIRIGRSRARKFWDIGVADDPRLFALASGVLSHNSKPNPMPESVTDRPTKAHEYLFLLSKRARYYYDADAVREASKTPAGLTWDERKAKGPGKNDGVSWRNDVSQAYASTLGDGHGRNRRTVWTIATHPYPGAHFATFPPGLVEPCIKAGTSERGACPSCGVPWGRVTEREARIERREGDDFKWSDMQVRGGNQGCFGHVGTVDVKTTGWHPSCDCMGEIGENHTPDIGADGEPICHNAPIPCTVLDPFGGAGTTGLVADRLGRDAILIELNPEYADMGANRIRADSPMFSRVEVE
jgi:hypothetical protein